MGILKRIEQEFNRFIIKQFKNAYKKNPDDLMFNDVIGEANSNKGWSSFFPYAPGFPIYWVEYYIKNKDIFDDKFALLNKNLDEESIEAAKLLFERNVFFAFCKNHEDKFLFNYNKIFTRKELEEIKKIQDFKSSKKYKFPVNHEIKELEIYKQGYSYVKAIVENYIKGKDIIDGGAFIGDSAVVFSEVNPGRIYSFEPNQKNFELLTQTIKLNNFENLIYPQKLGLGKENRTINFSGDANYFTSANSGQNEEQHTIEVVSIDNFVNDNKSNVGIIKLDVEGLELDIIKGAIDTIKTQRPVLLISVYHKPEDLFEIKPLIENITDYKFLIRNTFFSCLNTEFMLVAYPRELKNGR